MNSAPILAHMNLDLNTPEGREEAYVIGSVLEGRLPTSNTILILPVSDDKLIRFHVGLVHHERSRYTEFVQAIEACFGRRISIYEGTVLSGLSDDYVKHEGKMVRPLHTTVGMLFYYRIGDTVTTLSLFCPLAHKPFLEEAQKYYFDKYKRKACSPTK